MTENKGVGPVDFYYADFDAVLSADIDGLLDAPEKPKKVTSSDRLERAFLEIVEFRRTQGRLPSSTTREIGERKLGARLDGILASEEKVEALKHLDDEFSLLAPPEAPSSLDELLEGDDLGLLGDDDSGIFDVSDLPTRKAPDSASSVAKRRKAEDFAKFEHLFKQKHAELGEGAVALAPFKGVQTVQEGRFFVLNGVMAFIAEVGESTTMIVGGKPEQKQRLRVIFENGTESSMYRQSFSIRMHEQEGLAIVNAGLDDSELLDGDVKTGHIYVLQSLSADPQIASIPNLHKIGFTTTAVEQRIKNAEKSPTYLMAPVRVVEDYTLFNVKASALEHLLHLVFAEVRLDLTQVGADGKNYDPSEWFVVPRKAINRAITMITSGEIERFKYDAGTETFASLD